MVLEVVRDLASDLLRMRSEEGDSRDGPAGLPWVVAVVRVVSATAPVLAPAKIPHVARMVAILRVTLAKVVPSVAAAKVQGLQEAFLELAWVAA